MKKLQLWIMLFVFVFVISACSNVPQVPTKTPTMSPEELMQSAQETADALRRETETQWAIENPSPTPTETPPPTPEATATSAIPMIPPTATAEPLPYLKVGYTTYTVYKIGEPGNTNFVPMDNLYIETCFTNAGSAIWNENYYCQVVRQGGSVILPDTANYLGKNVANGEKACFSFNRQGSANTALGQQCTAFQLYTDTGAAMANGYMNVCWTIH